MVLKGKKIAMIVTHGFEQSEMVEPKKALEAEGATVDLISLEKGKVKGWKSGNWADEFVVDKVIQEVNPADYDALVLPGGVGNPDKLRMNNDVIQFVKKIVASKKLVAAICHGPWTLINAEVVKGHCMTSWPSIKVDLMNAGADWVDEEVVVDKKLITSRKPADLPAFNQAIIQMLSEK